MKNWFEQNIRLFAERYPEEASQVIDAKDALAWDHQESDRPAVHIDGKMVYESYSPNPPTPFPQWDENIVHLGFGLGWEWIDLSPHEKGVAQVLFVEPSVALFAKALTWYDFSDIIQANRCHFLVGHPPHKLLHHAERFLSQSIHFPPHLVVSKAKNHPFGAQWQAYAEAIQHGLQYNRNRYQSNIARAETDIINPLKNLSHYANSPHISGLKHIWKNQPGVLIGAGPSLAAAIPQLKTYQANIRTVSVSTALLPLLAAGITPNIVVCLDHHERSAAYLEQANTLPGDTRPLLVLDPQAHPLSAQTYQGPKMYISQYTAQCLMHETWDADNTIEPGSSVAHNAFSLLQFTGVDPIGLIGMDLAYYQWAYHTPGTANLDNHLVNMNCFTSHESFETEQLARFKPMRVELPSAHANIPGTTTDQLMMTYRTQFESLLARANQRVMHCGDRVAPLRGADINSLDTYLKQYAKTALPPSNHGDIRTCPHTPSTPKHIFTLHSEQLNERKTMVDQALHTFSAMTQGVSQSALNTLGECDQMRLTFEQTDWDKALIQPLMRETQVNCMKKRRFWRANQSAMTQHESMQIQLETNYEFWQGYQRALNTLEAHFNQASLTMRRQS